MTENRYPAVWLRALAGLLALAGMLGLSACGGGSGAPDSILPLKASIASADIFALVNSTLTVTGGTTPYRLTASNPAVVQISAGQAVAGSSTYTLTATNVAADTPVLLTVQDAAGASVAINLVAHPAPAALNVVPATGVVYSGVPATLSVAGGAAPYTAF